MLVQKFGGSSIASAEKLQSVAKIIAQSTHSNKVAVVLSAMGKVTDELINIIETAIKGNDWETLLNSLQDKHHNILTSLDCSCLSEAQKQQNHINYLFQEAHAKLQGIALLKQCPDDIYAWLITLGEQLSVSIMYAQLIPLGLTVQVIDSRKCIKTTEETFSGTVNIEQTKQNFTQYKNQQCNVLLMAGFASSSPTNKATTLGRNGSDYTAALCAISFEAHICQIWTDVDGVFNANPRDINSAYLIPQLSYYEAMELSYFGASVLHPKTITPL
ncbi:MAG: aspartate kinase, partial [Proteobacteria bacterium]|nr:aspartate kinase [Pseudomonadota bacterium]